MERAGTWEASGAVSLSVDQGVLVGPGAVPGTGHQAVLQRSLGNGMSCVSATGQTPGLPAGHAVRGLAGRALLLAFVRLSAGPGAQDEDLPVLRNLSSEGHLRLRAANSFPLPPPLPSSRNPLSREIILVTFSLK